MAVQRQGVTSALIESGRVLDVDIENYTLTVTTQYTKKPQSGISFATPYQHFANGEGIYFMPEVGSLCWICFPSDGSRPFVLAWMPAIDGAGFRSNKMALNPGDIYLGTRDENFLILRRGGVVQIGGGPLNQRIFLPVNNAIKDFCENYYLKSLGGDLEWTISREDTRSDGKNPTKLLLKAREFATDETPIATLEIGSHEGDDQTILSLTINDAGSASPVQKISLKMAKSGAVTFDVEDNITVITKGSYSLTSEKSISLTAKESFTANGSDAIVEALDADATFKAAVNVILKAGGKVTMDPMVYVGGGTTPVMLATPALLSLIVGHGHSALGAPPTQAATIADQKHVSKTIFGK